MNASLNVVFDSSVLYALTRESAPGYPQLSTVPPFTIDQPARMCLSAAAAGRMNIVGSITQASLTAAEARVSQHLDDASATETRAGLRSVVDAVMDGKPLHPGVGSTTLDRGGYEDAYDAVEILCPHILVTTRPEIPDELPTANGTCQVWHPRILVSQLRKSRF